MKTAGPSTPEPAKQITENGAAASGKTKNKTSPAARRPSPQRQAGAGTPSFPATMTRRAHTKFITERERTPERPSCSPDMKLDALSDPPRSLMISSNPSEGQHMKLDASQANSTNLWELFTVSAKEHSSACSSSTVDCTENMDQPELSEPNSPVCLVSPCTGCSPNTIEEDDKGSIPCSEINTDKYAVTNNGGSSLRSDLEPSFLSSEQEFVSKDVQCSKHEQSNIAFQRGEDKFTVQELLSSAPEVAPPVSSAPEVAHSIPATKGTLLDAPISLQSWKRHVVSHLNPPVDDVIQTIRHSTFCVSDEQPTQGSVQREAQSADVIKLLDVVPEGADARSSSPNTVPPARSSSVTATPHVSEANVATKALAASDNVKLSAASSGTSNGTKEEASPTKEALDVTSFRQRAEALEGLLELSADLLENQRLEELAIVLKPFGKNKVSPRETAIWLARSFKGMMSDEAGRTSL
jgi:NIMA (never in mitosis gene a)-related kinase